MSTQQVQARGSGSAPAPTTPKSKSATIKDQLQEPAFRNAVAQALPKHLTPDRFIRTAILCMTKTPKLMECDKASFFSALLTLSQLGIEPDGRRAHLIPIENRRRGCMEVQLIIDYKGLAELIMRSGVVSYLHADVVCENDEFDFNCGEIKRHSFKLGEPRGRVLGAFAICRFKDGSSKAEVMGKEDIESVRSRSRAANSGPWVTDWNEMAKKTVFRRLSKWLPLSPEIRDGIEVDDDDNQKPVPKMISPTFGGPEGSLELPEAPVTPEIAQNVATEPVATATEAPADVPEAGNASSEVDGRLEPVPAPVAGKAKPKGTGGTAAVNPLAAVRAILTSQGIKEQAVFNLLVSRKIIDDSVPGFDELAFIDPAKMGEILSDIDNIVLFFRPK